MTIVAGDQNAGAASNSAAPRQRPPLKAVTVLLPVWGFRFVGQFLEFGLPTLLAPGNVPAIASGLPCTFVLMTSSEDVEQIKADPGWERLSAICRAEIRLIDDLITESNHSATITLAFARAVRAAGEAMLDTCFIFLVSDYLVADGALATAVEKIRQGASGVQAGNFQIVSEDAIPLLRQRLAQVCATFEPSARELMALALSHLHPATAANTVNFPLMHNVHTNRLFWRVDDTTLIGRFFLMHMIAIRPEVTNFIVGASCDYSFVPEMCPSGNVTVITDSDQYLVVEMQPRDHEWQHLAWGPLEPAPLAVSLGEWTTQQHRANAAHTLLFHAGDVPSNTATVMKQADDFIAEVTRRLTGPPQPYRNHPYWIGSIAVHRAATQQRLSNEDWEVLLGEVQPGGNDLMELLWRARMRLLGMPPEVTRWHFRWPDFRLLIGALQRRTATGRIVVMADSPTGYAYWLAKSGHDVTGVSSRRLFTFSKSTYMPLVGQFDTCIAIVSEGNLAKTDTIVARIAPLLRPEGRILVLVPNDRIQDAFGFGSVFAQHAGRFLTPSLVIEDIQFVGRSRWCARVYRTMVRLNANVRRAPLWYLPIAAFAGPLLMIATYLCNHSALRAPGTPPRSGYCSSVFMTMKLEHPELIKLPDFETLPPARWQAMPAAMGIPTAAEAYRALRLIP